MTERTQRERDMAGERRSGEWRNPAEQWERAKVDAELRFFVLWLGVVPIVVAVLATVLPSDCVTWPVELLRWLT